MSFVSLQESLRRELRRRIDAGHLTGMELARRTGFTQAHVSNFLNRKRGLKLAALDKMLKAIGLSVYDLLNPHDLARFAAVPAGAGQHYTDVPLVEARVAAAREVIVNEEVKELVKFPRAFLSHLRPQLAAPARRIWTRFVLIELDPKDGMSMWPPLGPGSMLLLDRHYNSLQPYRKNERNLYAVRKPQGCTVRYVELSGKFLILRPHHPAYPVEVLSIEEGQSYAEWIVGRVAHAGVET